MNPAKIGDSLPDFALPDQNGAIVTRDALLARGALVLFFYPKDDTPGCTREVCAFRDAFEAFSDAGVNVAGVSSDDVAAHERFAQRHRLPFILLSDKGGALRKQLGVPKTLGFVPGRVTYVVDRTGTIRHIFSSQFEPERHIAEALSLLGALSPR
jgi:peroxiredoxin Q/BCP